MVYQYTERLRLVPLVLHPVDTFVRDHIGQIAMLHHCIVLHINKAWIIVITLTGHDFPFVKSLWSAFQMPFTENSCLIACLLQILGKCGLITVKHTMLIVRKSVRMAMFAGKHTCSRRTGQ